MELLDRSEELLGSRIDFVLPQNRLRLKIKMLKGKQLLGKGAYQADIVLDGKYILDFQLMRGCHVAVYQVLLWRYGSL